MSDRCWRSECFRECAYPDVCTVRPSPAHGLPDGLQVDLTAEVLLRDPRMGTAGTDEVIPLVALMDWSEVPIAPEADCSHEDTLCPTCRDEWAADHHVRIRLNGDVGWQSAGCPPAG